MIAEYLIRFQITKLGFAIPATLRGRMHEGRDDLFKLTHYHSGWYTYEGPDSLLNSRIHQAISPVGLDPAVGLMMFDWVQPMDRPPFELSTHGCHLMKLAESTSQPRELTEWLSIMPSPMLLPRTR